MKDRISITGRSTSGNSGTLGKKIPSDRVRKINRPTMIVALTCNRTARLTFVFEDDSDEGGEPATGNKF